MQRDMKQNEREREQEMGRETHRHVEKENAR